MYDIFIFGTGSGYNKVKNCLNYEKVNILACIDNDKKKQNKFIDDIKIILPDKIKKYSNYNCIIIASQYFKEIKNKLIGLEVPKEKILCFFEMICLHPKIVEFYHSKKQYEGFVTGISYAEYGIDFEPFTRDIFNLGLSSQDL